MTTESITSGNNPYQTLMTEFEATLNDPQRSGDIYQSLCTLLRRRIPYYTWVGVYLRKENLLRLRAWDGPAPTEHTAIEVGSGICGAAAKTGETEIIPDVNADPRYLQCFLSTRSEIVVPIKDSRQVYGEIDIDSDSPNAFTLEDKRFLEFVATQLLTVIKN